MEEGGVETFRRIDVLAQHRKTPAGFIDDRRSVYWVDKLPPVPGAPCALTKRQKSLTKNKCYHKDYQPDLPSPMRHVPSAALTFCATARLGELANPKPFPNGWLPARSAFTVVSCKAPKAKSTKRIKELACPKLPTKGKVKLGSEWEWQAWQSDVPKTALMYLATTRIEQLAEAKTNPENYIASRDVMWPVSEVARQAQTSARMAQLARPKTRQALDQDYDPYKVSFAARMAVPSPRVEDLCRPIPRKIRNKK